MIESLTPLIAIDAIGFDIEATGLDVRTASVVEIGAVRIVEGTLRTHESYQSLVRPLGSIDPAAVRIHGIDDAQARDAPEFADVWPRFAEFAGGSALIGHTLGFDLSILQRQVTTSGLAWRTPRMLDTQLLAQLVAARTDKWSLDDLAARLRIAPIKRHSALADAMLAAEVFLALLPELMRKGIRTFGAAEAACRSLTASLIDYHRAGWVEPIAPAAAVTSASPARRDLYAYRHRVADLMSAPPRFVPSDTPLAEALNLMMHERISSVFVGDADATDAGRGGIVTERDVLRAFALRQSDAFEAVVGELMSSPLLTVASDAFVYVAIARMRRFQIRHLAVVDERSRIVGAVSARDLLRQHAEPIILLDDEIELADSTQSLSKVWAKLHIAVAAMRSEVPARELAGLISQIICEMTARAVVLAERRMLERGLGLPPCPYAMLVLGSAGRGESLLGADQDNALVFLSGEIDGVEDRWFAALAAEVADSLNIAGLRYCPGGVMAKNAAWRGSIATWTRRVENWIDGSSPADLLSVDIFFDMKPVHGDAVLALSLRDDAFARGCRNANFAKQLVEASAGHMASGLTWFGRFNATKGRIDLKRSGTFGLVTAARALAIRHDVRERSTFLRLQGLKAKGLGHEPDFDRFAGALDLFLELMLRQQLRDVEDSSPSNDVDLNALSRVERGQLRLALAHVADIDNFVRDLLF